MRSSSQETINAQLRKDAADMVCDAGTTPAEIASRTASQKTTVTFVSERLLAIDVSSEIFCGGAHPSHGLSSQLFDLKKGEQIELSIGAEVNNETPSKIKKA